VKVSLSWLAELADLPDDATLARRLEMSGFEDVVIEARGPDLARIVVGEVVARDAHPQADRLSVCTVEVGDGTPRTIVCGAPNVAAGQKVAVALPGVRLPDGTKIKKSKLRGVKSEGMICSDRELGLGDAHEGIRVLDPAAPVGAALPDVVPVGDRVLEVGITPNRGDTASLLGLAREVRALFGGKVRLPETAPEESGAPAADAVALHVDAADGCHHYAARIVRGVRVGPSPEALRARLEASGIRPINNVVDATNAVMLELGQPLHAFDLAKLGGATIRVRRAAPGETLETLDGQTRRLDPRDLVIADASRPVALAGVMGGAESEVTDATTDLLVESAHFHPTSVRMSARRHGLHSEASYRFERGVDRDGVVRAADRAARRIAELAGGVVAPGVVEARGDAPAVTERITLRVERSNRLLGLDLAPAEVASLLERVGVAARESAPGVLDCAVPSHRNDLHRHQDLTEEVARIHGYENIPTTLPVAELLPARVPESHRAAEAVRDLLCGAGLVETASFPFVGAADLERLRLSADDPRRRAVRIRNPIQEQDDRLRTSLVPSLLRLVRQNASRQVERIGLFEVAKVFWPRGEGAGAAGDAAPDTRLPEEPLWAAGVVSEALQRGLWAPRELPPVFFLARGIAEKALSGLGYMASLRRGDRAPYLHPGASAGLVVDGVEVGVIGELHPEVAAAFEIEAGCALFELNLSALLAVKKREIQFREVSREPSVRRDLALVVDATRPAGALVEEMRKVGGADLVSIELFDRYAGPGVPEGCVSLAFRLVFQRADRTLTDAEVTRATERMVAVLTERFGAELR